MPCCHKDIVVIPLYNEVKTIESILEKVHFYTKTDILVIDDGSDDGSAQKLPDSERLTVITHPQNIGYGQSLIDGFRYAIDNNYDRVVTIDCDDQHEPQMIHEFFDGLDNLDNIDILSGSRYLVDYDDNSPPPSDRKDINMRITNLLNRITGFNLTDSFCGFKGYQVEALAKLSLTEQGYGMPLQLWIQACKKQLRITEKATKRIYSNVGRIFGVELDDPEKRFIYYKNIMEGELPK